MKIRVLLLVAALAACGKKREEPAATPPPVPTVVADAAAGSGADVADAEPTEQAALDLPTATDFEEQAEADITDKNVEAYVTSIEQELGQ